MHNENGNPWIRGNYHLKRERSNVASCNRLLWQIQQLPQKRGVRLVFGGLHAQDGEEVEILALEPLELGLVVGDLLHGGEQVLEGGGGWCHCGDD